MLGIQYIQVLGNSILSVISFSGFIIIADYMRLTKSKCNNNIGNDENFTSYSCTVYHSFQANAAFSFFLIFIPWIGIFGALQGIRKCTYIYLAVMIISFFTYFISDIIILSNDYVQTKFIFFILIKKGRQLWRYMKEIDSIDISAIQEAYLASYNMIIAQMVLMWIFLVLTAISTLIATKKQEECEQEISRPLN